MNVGQIGERFKTVQRVDYKSSENFLDYDMFIVDLDSAIIQKTREDFLDANDIKRRHECFIEFMEHKTVPLIVFVPIEAQFKFHLILNNNYANTSKNIDSLVPFNNFRVISEKGKRIDIALLYTTKNKGGSKSL